MGLLDGKRILITGVLMDSSIAFHVARIAQQEGAEVVLTSFGRTMRITQTIAKRLPTTPPVIELDASNADDFAAMADRVREHVDGLDGVLHSIGFAPEAALGGNFLNTEWADVATAVQISAYSLKALAVAAQPLMPVGRRGGRPHLRRDGRVAEVRLDGCGQGGVRVDRALPGARPRAEGDPRQPGGGRAAEDDRGQVDPGVRGVRGRLVDARPARRGTSPTSSRRRGRAWP